MDHSRSLLKFSKYSDVPKKGGGYMSQCCSPKLRVEDFCVEKVAFFLQIKKKLKLHLI